MGSFVELNWGDRELAPELITKARRKEDAKANAERDRILIEAGIRMPRKWFYQRHGIPLPKSGEEVIS